MSKNAKQNVEKALFNQGRMIALNLQKKSKDMTGTELNEEKDFVPNFIDCLKPDENFPEKITNMLNRPIGFICKSPSGRIVKLLQPYDSNIYTQEPEELSAQWGFVWSKNPEDALPFISIATSPYMKNEVCSFENKTYKATIDNLVHSPKDFPSGWKEI